MKQYAERDIMTLDELGNHYGTHVQAMTTEKLHSKSDIAAELAWRDAEIDRLKQERDQLKAHIQILKSAAYGVMESDDMEDEEDKSTMHSNLNDALLATPEQSLAAHDVDVIENLQFPTLLRKMWSGSEVQAWLKECADQLRQQAKAQPVNDSCELECGAHGTFCRCRAEKAKEVQS